MPTRSVLPEAAVVPLLERTQRVLPEAVQPEERHRQVVVMVAMVAQGPMAMARQGRIPVAAAAELFAAEDFLREMEVTAQTERSW